jgi:hypothetical protein
MSTASLGVILRANGSSDYAWINKIHTENLGALLKIIREDDFPLLW